MDQDQRPQIYDEHTPLVRYDDQELLNTIWKQVKKSVTDKSRRMRETVYRMRAESQVSRRELGQW